MNQTLAHNEMINVITALLHTRDSVDTRHKQWFQQVTDASAIVPRRRCGRMQHRSYVEADTRKGQFRYVFSMPFFDDIHEYMLYSKLAQTDESFQCEDDFPSPNHWMRKWTLRTQMEGCRQQQFACTCIVHTCSREQGVAWEHSCIPTMSWMSTLMLRSLLESRHGAFSWQCDRHRQQLGCGNCHVSIMGMGL